MLRQTAPAGQVFPCPTANRFFRNKSKPSPKRPPTCRSRPTSPIWSAGAIVKNTITLAYQPVVNSENPSKIAFYEGLIRVPDDTGKIIPAVEFIDKIERNSLGRMVDCCAL